MVVKIDISIAINIMDFAFAPIQMIISGPKETFGREFKTVKYGSKTLAMNLFDQSILAINIPIILDNEKLIIVSYSVTNMCDVRSLFLNNDIIVFKTNGSDDAALHISRVIGLPGETVQISGGKILINGAVYENDGDFPEISNGGLASSAVSLESGEYFVLGDNRNNSEDSRYADIGNVKKKYIVGKLWFTISPRSKIGFLKG